MEHAFQTWGEVQLVEGLFWIPVGLLLFVIVWLVSSAVLARIRKLGNKPRKNSGISQIVTKDQGEEMDEIIKQARQLCGCTQCHGGYDVGARTIASQVNPVQPRPSSCVAAVVLSDLLKNK